MKDIYLIHGWKVDETILKQVLADMKPEAFDRGLRVIFPDKGVEAGRGVALAAAVVIFPDKGVEAFLGEVLLTVRSPETSGAVIPPSLADGERLQRAMQALGLDGVAMDRPMLWVVAA